MVSSELNYGEAALELFDQGFQPVPIRPGTKQPAVKWKNGRFEMTRRNIRRYWQKHPDHELGVIIGSSAIVFDADTQEGVIALYMLWDSLDVSPNLIVETDRGEHHYFSRAEDVFAKSDAPDKADYPERVDVKTGNAIAIVPPSPGKQYLLKEIENVCELVAISQEAIDAVFRHNGREAPRPPGESGVVPTQPLHDGDQSAADIEYLLTFIDPDCGYEDWMRVGMAIHHELGGSDVGFTIFDDWSANGSKYPGCQELLIKWRSMDGFNGTPVAMGTLCRLASENGADLDRVAEEFFDVIEDAPAPLPEHTLVPYSLRGMSGKFEAEMLEHRFILDRIAIVGQWTVIYARPNMGKTLLVIWLIIQGIQSGDIDPECLFYVNADDDFRGLTAKLKLAEEHGFHMLAPEFKGFRVNDFLDLLEELTRSNQAQRTVIVLDTLKKFVSLMDKKMATAFGTAIRAFISKGGTLIALAHVNKRRDDDDKPVYAGTTDIVDDADCAFVVDILTEEGDYCTVEFENIKSRGLVARRAAFRYSRAESLDYTARLDSVCAVDDSAIDQLREAAAKRDELDDTLVPAIEDCIADGITSKTKILSEIMKNTGASRREVERTLGKYTGDDPTTHRWNFTRGAKGLTTYALLQEPGVAVEIHDLDTTYTLSASRAADDTGNDLDDEEVY